MPHLTRLIIVCSCFLSLAVHAASVWKVSNKQHTIYIAGTMHLLSDSDYPLPKEYQQAYEKADTLVFETDMQAIQTTEFKQQILALMTYNDGRNLQSVLHSDTFHLLDLYLQEHKLQINNMLNYKPSLVVLTLSMMEFQTLGLNSIGVDQYFSNQASKNAKPQQYLETPEQQLSYLADIGEDDEDALVAFTLRDLKELPAMMGQMKAHWRSGDMQKLADLSITPFVEDYPEIYQQLLVTRNALWLPKIEQMLQSADVELVLVGALHLAGKDSVLSQLATKGFNIEKL
jgi:uncharacterized protein YbaP (TraB family)